MIQRYPVGIQDFSEIRNGGYVYVDKTFFIEKLLNQSKFYFLSRPRRFGKSLLLSTIEYLFKAHQALFKGLYIEDKWDWNHHNPVVKISFSNIGHKDLGLSEAISQNLHAIAKQYNISLQSSHNSGQFKELIEALSVKHGKVVVLIDEYDKPIIDYIGTGAEGMLQATKNRDILKAFYSILKDADPFLRFVFITGVSKFSRVSIFSDLNNLKDLSVDTNFEDICGINEEELKASFEEELKIANPEKIKQWYNGYSWGGSKKVYNPFSVLNFFAGDGRFRNYWFETGTPTFLVNLAKDAQLYDFENQRINTEQLNSYDLEHLQIIPLMFQTGYLTIKDYDEIGDIYTLDYPNLEVRRSYLESLVNNYIQSQKDKAGVVVYDIHTALIRRDFVQLQLLINTLFKSIPYTIWQNENEHFYHAILHLTFRMLNIYVTSEVQTSDGRMDALVQTDQYVYCFEFKLDHSANIALQQIKDKGYLQPYLHQGKICIAIGVNFSKEHKKIEQIVWEEVE
jgi:Predicted AAA-ATPase/PD-(D/E)XK nuclease superfamily